MDLFVQLIHNLSGEYDNFRSSVVHLGYYHEILVQERTSKGHLFLIYKLCTN